MIITIQDKNIEQKDIKKLYPAGLVKTGHGDEVTEISLEWIDTEGGNDVEIAGYGIFVITKYGEKLSFLYESREELEKEIEELAKQFNK